MQQPDRSKDLSACSVLDALSVEAKALFTTRFPGQSYDSSRWRFRVASSATLNQTKGKPVSFIADARRQEPYSRECCEALKCIILLEDLSFAMAARLTAGARYLWMALRERFDGQTHDISWCDVEVVDLDRAIEILSHSCSPGTVYGYGNGILHLIRWLEENTLIDTFDWHHGVANPNVVGLRTLAGKRKRRDRLPTTNAIRALGTIYREHAVSPQDRLLICAVGLLLLCGFRVSEVLSLPVDCLIEEMHRGRRRFAIRYWNAKSRGSSRKWAKRWLSPLAAVLAQDLLDEVHRITADARMRARELDKDLSAVRIPNTTGQDWIITPVVAAALGVKPGTLGHTGGVGKELESSRRPMGPGKFTQYSRIKVEEILQSRRVPYLDVGDGVRQPLAGTLFICLQNFFDVSGIGSPLLVHPLTRPKIADFLTSRGHVKSAFERFGITEPDPDGGERICRVRTHAPRHWLNSIANRSGMSAFQITLWMQRIDSRQTELYLHDPEEQAEFVREGISSNDFVGQKQDQYNELHGSDADGLLESIQTAQKVSDGYCLKNLRICGCGKMKACAFDCSYLLHTAGDPEERASLLAKKDALEACWRRYDIVESHGRKIAQGQRRFTKGYLANVERLLGLSGDGFIPPRCCDAESPSVGVCSVDGAVVADRGHT